MLPAARAAGVGRRKGVPPRTVGGEGAEPGCGRARLERALGRDPECSCICLGVSARTRQRSVGAAAAVIGLERGGRRLEEQLARRGRTFGAAAGAPFLLGLPAAVARPVAGVTL
jgi:hypothetical protein